jgi:adenylate kinase family enzyme
MIIIYPGARKEIPSNQICTELSKLEADFSRVILFGHRASGKSTFSAQLADHLNLAQIEFDVIRRKRNGAPVSGTDYSKTLTELVQQPRWVAEGGYLEGVDRLAMPIVWPLATIAIWFDLPFQLTMRRLVARTYRRIIHKEVMWNNMQDKKSSLLKRLASGNAIRAYVHARKAYPVYFNKPEYSHLTFLHLKTQADVDGLVASITRFT